MFRLHKQKSDKSSERFDFKLSDIQALQVPKGWDRLSVSIVSLETAKTIGRSAKAPVWNGSCQWTESFSESLWIPAYDDSKECLFKAIVFMGSSRSGMLGEATINLANFTSSRTAVPLSLQLKKCSHGTVLQMKVHCLNPRTDIGDEEPGKDTTSTLEEANIDYDDIENKSDVSDNLSRMSSGSVSSNHMDAQFHPGETVSRETSFSASGSHYSFDSGEGSFGRETFSPHRNINGVGGGSGHIGNQDSYDSPSRSNNSFSSKTPRPRNSFQNEDLRRSSRTYMGSPFRGSGTSKDLVEAVEMTVEEVRAESRTWEKKARKVTADLEDLQKKFSIELEQKEALEMELSASKTESDELRWEIGELKATLREQNSKQNAADGIGNLQKELEEELKFLKESNADLSIQLQKTQESNIELVSILQEMEETIEKQKKEIAGMSVAKEEDEQGREETHDEDTAGERSPAMEIESLRTKVQELERDCNELTDENLQLLFKLKESQNLRVWDASSNTSAKDGLEDEAMGSEKRGLESRVRDLEEELSIRNGECLALKEKRVELEVQLQAFKEEVSRLKAEHELAGSEKKGLEVRAGELEEELSLKERDCSGLREKCAELEEQLNTFRGRISQFDAERERFGSEKRELKEDLSTKYGECSGLQEKCAELEVQLQTSRERVSQLDAEVRDSRAKADDWEIQFAELEKQLEGYRNREEIPLADDAATSSSSVDLEMTKGTYFITQSDQHEAISSKIAIMRGLVEKEDCEREADANVMLNLDQQLVILQANLESKLRELSSELLDKVSELEKMKAENLLNREEADVLRVRVSTIEEEKSRFEALSKRSLELELDRTAIEDHLSELENENVSLSERICGLEAQLRYLTDDRETSRLALQRSESRCSKLQEDVRELESRMAAQKADLRGKLGEVQKQLSETREECGYLQIANRKLEATAESVIDECTLLQKSNAELRAENSELNGNSAVLEAELSELRRAFDRLSVEIETLQEKYDTLSEETAFKERALKAELDALLLEHKRVNSSSISGTEMESEVRMASEEKVHQLMGELSASKQNQDILTADREKLRRLLDDSKSNEARMKSDVRRLELKLKRCEYERKHLVEEISTLKDQLLKAELLEIEVSNLRRVADESKFENERLEASFQVLLGDYTEVKSERDSYAEKISSMEGAVVELEACRDNKVVLEERVLRLEGDLTAREALYAEDAELKNELARVRRTNTHLQRRVEEYESRAQALQQELLKPTDKDLHPSVSEGSELSTLQKDEMHGEESRTELRQNKAANGMDDDPDPLLKVQLLENELAETLEANDMYKEQLKSLLSNEETGAVQSELTKKLSSLENELKELRESYFHMSLKYAEGEAEKEELVMRLKAM